MRPRHAEFHRVTRIGWLRAAVLGANDGILSTASVVLGVAAAHGTRTAVLVACVAALVAGAMSMAAGEYVSVSSQADTERADLARERRELASAGAAEQQELAGIYRERGLAPALATEVARQLMQHDALAAHARDELGITPHMEARPVQAALASAASFAVGGALPLLVVSFTPLARLVAVIVPSTLLCLAVLGSVAARAGGAPVLLGAIRVVFWGALAMAATWGIGALVGVQA